MRSKILFPSLLTFCLGLSAQNCEVSGDMIKQTAKKVSRLLETSHRMLNPSIDRFTKSCCS